MNAQPNHKGRSLLSRDQLAKVHIAKKALCLDGESYRAILHRVTGHESARDIMPDQLPDLQREFRRLGWDGYLLTRDEMHALRGETGKMPALLKYSDCDNRPGRPTGAQLRMLEARFRNIRGFADVQPGAALRGFLEKRYHISDMRLLDDRTYQAALNAVKRLEGERGVKKEWGVKKSRGVPF
jgi:hypothetical protein